uniref:DUF2098 domain-containing protein n=1 Tax=Candidatus Methanogaster sp. ANME-2c ERB4 TaxID=2759911 RepID=A0A7G9YG51_9EURY|nr:hypothetical protein CLAIAILK_00047 [Methanosarcinales archaeon ANME-2c ERB4]
MDSDGTNGDSTNGDGITVGSTVRYAGTGSVGKVKRIQERDHELWARVDSTGLWYKASALEVLGEEFEQKEWDKELTLDELKRVEARKMDSINNVQQILEAELCESGG